MSVTIKLLDWIGERVARQLQKPTSGYEPYAAARPELVAMTIRPADVLLVEGPRSKINSAIRYLTQSTWSHSAMYVGLGAGLGLPVIAEGVETAEELGFLVTEKYHAAQGYFIGRPGPISEFAQQTRGARQRSSVAA